MQGCSSDVFIREAMRLMHERGYKLGNLDATIIAEVPPHSLNPEVQSSRSRPIPNP